MTMSLLRHDNDGFNQGQQLVKRRIFSRLQNTSSDGVQTWHTAGNYSASKLRQPKARSLMI